MPPLKLLRQALLNGDDYQACQIFTVSGRQSESNVDTKLQELGLEMFDDRNSSGYNPDASPSSSANYSGNREEITNLYEYLDPSAYFPYVRCGDTTPLHLACETACPNILQLFLEHGANPNVTNERGETALHVLCSRPENSDQRLMMLDMLVKWEYDGRLVRNISSNTPLSAPGEKLSLNRVDKYGNSALHFAASNGLIDIVRRLIELGAIVSIVNKNNQSCCDLSDCYPEYNSISNMLEIALVYSPLTEDELLIQQFEENDPDRSNGDADVSCNGFDLEQATKYTSVSGLSKVLVGPQLFYQHESHIQLYNRMDVVLSHNRSLHACEVQDNMLTIDTTCVMTLVQIEQYMQIATWMVCDITGLHSTRAEWLCAKYNWNIKQLLLDLYYHLDHVLQIAKMPTHITAREMILSCNQISSNYVKRLIASTVEKESTEENECELCEFNKIRTNVVRPVLSLPSTASVTYTAHLLSKRGAGKLAQKEQIPVDQEVEASMEAFDAEIFEDSEEEGVCEGNETENLKVSCGAKNVAPLDISFESSYEPMANYRSERSLNQRSDGIASQAEKNKANMLASSWFLCLEEYRECVLEFRPIVKNQSEETDAPIEDIASAKSDSRVISLSNSLVSTSTEDGDGKGEVYEQHDTVDHTVAMDSALVKSTVNDLVYSVSIGSPMVVSSRVPDATVVISSVATGATGTLSPTHSSTIVAHETPIKTEADATPPPNPWDYSCGICGDDLDLIVNSDVQQQWKKMLILKLEVIAQCDHLNKHVEGCNSSMNDTLLSCMDKEIIKYCNVFDKLSALLHSNDESVVFDELSSIADPVVGIRCGNACGVNTRLGHCAKEFDNVEEHLYCTTCWQGYFDMRVKEGAGGGSGGVGCVLQCPGYQCSESLDFDWFSELFYPSEVKLDGDGCTDTRDGIDRGLSSSLHQSVQKLLHTRLNQVVDSCDAFRWCPREDTCAGLVLCTDSFPMLLLSNYHHLTLTTSLFDPKFQALGLSNAMEPGGNMDSKSDVLPRHQIRTGLMRTLTSALSVSSPPHSFSNSNFMQYAPFQQRLEGTLLDLILNNKPSSLADPANAELTNAVKAVSATWPKTVLCDNHHSLCLSCSEEGHSPCTCVEWKKWRTKIGSALQATSSNKDGVVTTNSDELANALWVAANTKKCPRCSLPIEKDDGCNHMNCRKCK